MYIHVQLYTYVCTLIHKYIYIYPVETHYYEFGLVYLEVVPCVMSHLCMNYVSYENILV